MRQKLTRWSWEKPWNYAKFEIVFYDIKPKCFRFWKQNLVLLSPGHSTLLFLICLFWLGNKLLAMPKFHILDGIQLLPLYCAAGPAEGRYCSSNKLQCAFSKQNFPSWLCEGVRDSALSEWLFCIFCIFSLACEEGEGSGEGWCEDNNLRECAWCSQWNTQGEIPPNALVLYI